MNKPSKNEIRLPWLGRKLSFVDNMKNVDLIVYALYAICAALFLADFLYSKKVHVAAEAIPGFYAIYGFVMCAALVICAKVMRWALMRSEDYYAPEDVEAEDYPENGLDREQHHG